MESQGGAAQSFTATAREFRASKMYNNKNKNLQINRYVMKPFKMENEVNWPDLISFCINGIHFTKC